MTKQTRKWENATIFVLLGVFSIAVCSGNLPIAAHAQDTAVPASKYITEIQFDENGKSNLDELVKVPGKDSLVLFYNSDALNTEAHRNEYAVFEELANKYKVQISFYMYDIAKDNGYVYYKEWGIETKKEKIKMTPTVKMFKDGKEYDIREGGPTTATRGNSLNNCDLWIRYNLTDEFKDKPYTFLYQNSFDIHKVQRSEGPRL
ncbi:MAG: hypothetical protein JW765_11045 [Deltaproteobacteria bacterium]|nr:hypothetical protein [Candidatus Zymogenaceae bacterium]